MDLLIPLVLITSQEGLGGLQAPPPPGHMTPKDVTQYVR